MKKSRIVNIKDHYVEKREQGVKEKVKDTERPIPANPFSILLHQINN